MKIVLLPPDETQAARLERHGYRVWPRPARPFVLRLWHVVVSFALALGLAASGIAVVILGLSWLWRALL